MLIGYFTEETLSGKAPPNHYLPLLINCRKERGSPDTHDQKEQKKKEKQHLEKEKKEQKERQKRENEMKKKFKVSCNPV